MDVNMFCLLCVVVGGDVVATAITNEADAMDAMLTPEHDGIEAMDHTVVGSDHAPTFQAAGMAHALSFIFSIPDFRFSILDYTRVTCMVLVFHSCHHVIFASNHMVSK
jgi:hypothetical protein